MDTDEVDKLVADYDSTYTPDTSLTSTAASTSSTAATRSLDYDIYDCSGNTKWVYKDGTQVDLGSVHVSEHRPVLEATNDKASGILLAPNLVLAAGHQGIGTGDNFCVWLSTTPSWDCAGISDSFQNGSSGFDEDWELFLLDDDLATSYHFTLSSLSDSAMQTKTPRLAGYPSLPLGEEEDCLGNDFLQGERNTGDWQAVWARHIRVDITAGSGHSGGPYYYYPGSGTAYYLLGVHHGRDRTRLGNRYAGGPKVPYWREDIISAAAALGVEL